MVISRFSLLTIEYLKDKKQVNGRFRNNGLICRWIFYEQYLQCIIIKLILFALPFILRTVKVIREGWKGSLQIKKGLIWNNFIVPFHIWKPLFRILAISAQFNTTDPSFYFIFILHRPFLLFHNSQSLFA